MCEDIIEDALKELAKDGVFQIVQIDYDEQNFGNAVVTLKSRENVYLRFIKDRGAGWCEIGQGGQWYFVEDVFAVLDVAFVDFADDFPDYVEKTADVLKTMASHIFEAFKPENLEVTQAALKEAATKRAIELFKDNL